MFPTMNIDPVSELLERYYGRQEFPALDAQTSFWEMQKPLAGTRVLDATPVYRNSLLKYRALLAGGADLTVGISSVMAYDKRVAELLHECGIRVCRADDCDRGEFFDVVMDCAGAFSFLSPRSGFVELTRSGADAYRRKERPVFFADGGRIKKIETCLGTGESYFRAMGHLGFDDWKGKKLVLFGCGKVGSGILYYAHKLGAKCFVVTDVEVMPEQLRRLAEGCVDFRDSVAVSNVLEGAFAVVTATGVRNALGNIPAEVLTGCGAVLANMGVEDEFGPSVAPEMVLNGKHTLNFILDEPTQLRYIDATMALHNAGAAYLIEHRLPDGCGFILPPAEIEEEILDVTRRNGLIGDGLDIIA